MTSVLFVSYGGGHIEMCLPVIRALREQSPACRVHLMALTTAYSTAQRAGEAPLGYRDFCDEPDAAQALRYGETLLPGNRHPDVSREETLAYLGFNFLEWVRVEGESQAFERWRRAGRQGFLPVAFFKRVIQRLLPDIVVTTNSPRSEQAAIAAASALGLPSLSMVDLFALPPDPYPARSVHATRITVLAEATRSSLTAAGLDRQRIFVTGNPAFDTLATPTARLQGQRWRQALGWAGRHVIFWAGHKEPDDAIPSQWAGTRLGAHVQALLMDWVLSRDDLCLVVRYHPNEWHEFSPPAAHPRVHWSQPDQEPLFAVLAGADQVVVQATTVGVQAHMAGKRVLSLGFSPLVQRTGMNLARLGMGHGVNSPEDLIASLAQGLAVESSGPAQHRPNDDAAPAVARHILELACNRVSA